MQGHIEVYRVVLDIKGIKVYDPGCIIKNKIKEKYNAAEELLEKIRLHSKETLLPRMGAIYVCDSLDKAHYWYQKIDANQKCDYYIYKLRLYGNIQWHNSKYYELIFNYLLKPNEIERQISHVEIEEIAKLYWLKEESPSSLTSEGLFWGDALVVDRLHYIRNEM